MTSFLHNEIKNISIEEMKSCHFSGWEQMKSPKYLAGIMAADMRGTTCARTKTSKAPTRVTLVYTPYSVSKCPNLQTDVN